MTDTRSQSIALLDNAQQRLDRVASDIQMRSTIDVHYKINVTAMLKNEAALIRAAIEQLRNQ
jgi:hypothetical protein